MTPRIYLDSSLLGLFLFVACRSQMIPLLPPTSHPVLRDPTLPFKTTKRTKSKAAVHHDGTRGTKVYHNLNMSANHVRSVGGGRHLQQNGMRSCIVGKKNKYDKKGNLRMMKFTQAHIENSNNTQKDEPKSRFTDAKTTPPTKKRKTYPSSYETTVDHDDHHHMHIEACPGRNQKHEEHEEKHYHEDDEMSDAAMHHGVDEHSDAEIDYDQRLYDYRSASHSPLQHDHLPLAAEEEGTPVESLIISSSSPLPLCPPRHSGRKYLYEYESLDVERGLVRLPKWMASHERKNALETILNERFGKRYPVSWRKRTHVPLYNHKHYADAF